MEVKIRVAKRSGFSLIECVIAIGLVAVLLTTFMAIFGPAQQNISRALGVADANRLVSTLENEMAVLREGEETEYIDANTSASAFEKAFQWIVDSSTPTTAIVVYQYQAIPDQLNADGTLKAVDFIVSDDTKLPGVDYITQTIARSVGDSDFITDELKPGVVEGNVYAVRMTQLVKNAGNGLTIGTAGEIVNASDAASNPLNDSSEFTDAYITMQVEFFQLPNNLASYVTGGGWTFESLGKPVAIQNIGVRR